MRRPASATSLGVVLLLVATATLLFAALNIRGYFDGAASDGVATRMALPQYLLETLDRTVLPLVMGIVAAAAAVGVFRGRGWARAPAAAIGAVALLVGGALLVSAAAQWALPGSFAPLLVPPGAVAVLIGAFVLLAVRANRDYLRA